MKVIYRCCDLFSLNNEKYVFAHCVAKDLVMGAGIAVMFRQKYGKVDLLKSQRPKVGRFVFLEGDGNNKPIVYLVTKEKSYGIPSLADIRSSLRELNNFMKERKLEYLAIPVICCGLDRQVWDDVVRILEEEFRETDVKITVCYLPQGKNQIQNYIR